MSSFEVSSYAVYSLEFLNSRVSSSTRLNLNGKLGITTLTLKS